MYVGTTQIARTRNKPDTSNPRAGRGILPRFQLALQAAGKALHDKAATHPLGRCRDFPLSLAPCILDGFENQLGDGRLSAEFQHLRRDFAPYKVHFLGDIFTADGTCLLLPRRLRRGPAQGPAMLPMASNPRYDRCPSLRLSPRPFRRTQPTGRPAALPPAG